MQIIFFKQIRQYNLIVLAYNYYVRKLKYFQRSSNVAINMDYTRPK